MNPYQSLPPSAFWKPAVAAKHMLDIDSLWEPKFHIQPKHKVSTYGSCFAQHIGRSLQQKGYLWFVTEPGPTGLSKESEKRFNYRIFSSRTANIYTTSLLEQWTRWACEASSVPAEIWESDGRFYDPFRPMIEPDGFVSKEELEGCRQHTIARFRTSITEANFFVFTLGLTEHWVNSSYGYEYPLCPGTSGGSFDSGTHVFRNHGYTEVRDHLLRSINLMRDKNPDLRIILTVSPVPLTATNSGKHVLVATMHSKSILRAVAGQLAAEHDYIDYFPSYEIINSPVFRGSFFEPNLRSVHPSGVDFVMNSFFACLDARFGPPAIPQRKKSRKSAKEQDLICEEELLGAFSSTPTPQA